MLPSRNGSWLRRWAQASFTLDARSLAAYRIALGALLCLDCLLRTRDFDLMFAVDGIFPPAAMRRESGDPTAWSLAYVHDSTAWNAAVLALEGVAGLLLAVGAATRLATVLAWVAVVSIFRRTTFACNAGDAWLACQLFWAMFIPLGTAWSWDAHRRRVRDVTATAPTAVCSVATAALVLQLVAVYASAGVAKCNETWFGGGAVTSALSVHNFGSTTGMAAAHAGWLGTPAAWAVVALELAAAPLLLVWPTPRVRVTLAALFALFHVAIWVLMSVGLFVPISLAAWLPLLPAALWTRGRFRCPVVAGGVPHAGGLSRTGGWVCAACIAISVISLLNTRWWETKLPRPLAALVNLTALNQDWGMFGRVPPVEQSLRARAILADGREVDLLRGGVPCADGWPAGGFTSLPHHRWHKLCWILAKPASRAMAADVAAGLARRWNATHPASDRVASVEILHVAHETGGDDCKDFECVVASWPPRTESGGGNLDRFLQAALPASQDSERLP